MLKRIGVFTRFLDDGRICLSNNAAERELRGIALGRKSWLFAGSDRGGERAAVMLTLIQTAKLNDIDPQAWLADVLARINDHNITGWTTFCRGTGATRWISTTPPECGSTGYAITIRRAAEMLAEDEDLLWDIASEMGPEHGCLWIYDIGPADRRLHARRDGIPAGDASRIQT